MAEALESGGERFFRIHPKQEPGAVVPHARNLCEGADPYRDRYSFEPLLGQVKYFPCLNKIIHISLQPH